MNILFTSFYPEFQYHYVSELNLLQRHLDSNDDVWMTLCDADLKSCECNRPHLLARCLRCIELRKKGLELVRGKVNPLPLIGEKYRSVRFWSVKTTFSSLEELKSYQIENFDLGMAAYSSLVDRLGDTNPDVHHHRATIRDLVHDAWRVWKTAKKQLAAHHFDKVYIFNGRFAATRAWVRACEQAGVDYVTHERAGVLDKIFLSENTFPHDPKQYPPQVEAFWAAHANDPRVLSEGAEFFEERPRGTLTGWNSFVTLQEKNHLPESWDESKRNITIFASSDGEFVGLRDLYSDGLYTDQYTAYCDTVGTIGERDKSIFFYLRLHPNSSNEAVQWWEWEGLKKLPNLEVIPASSKVSTYALMKASEKCLAFLSTAGLEATYWGKPSLILNKARYSGIDAVYELKTREEAFNWILGYPQPKPKINAVKYGAYFRCAGLDLEYSEKMNNYQLSFHGKTLDPDPRVTHWLVECDKRPHLTGWKKYRQDRRDKALYSELQRSL